jgi:PKD repeat protein
MQNKILSVLICLLVIYNTACATSVSVQSAQVIALNYYKVTAPNLDPHTSLTAQLKYTQTESDGSVDFYVFDIQPVTGFVIVAGNDVIVPVLAYSTESHFVTGYQHVGLTNWMSKVSSRIHLVVSKQFSADSRIAALWTAYAGGNKPAALRSSSVSPLCTTTWDQSPYYNGDCPINPTDGQQCITGCVATAMAQIMKFWNYPAKGIGSSSYDCTVANNDQFNIGELSANYGATTFVWTDMPNSINGANSQIAELMYEAGVSVDMSYGDQESGAYVTQAEANQAFGYDNAPCSQYSYVNYFNYNSATLQGVMEKSYAASAWTALIENELNAGRPVQYEGYDPSQGGHTWVCDGYDVNNNLHMNWGWSGQDDGYYAINNLDPDIYDFSEQDGALIGIQPVSTAPVAALSANTSSSCSGSVQFTDNSTGQPTSWLWNFGDGTTSTIQNPLHVYSSNGTYTPTLKVTNSYGSNQAAISPGITVARPAAPTASGASHCSASTFSLSASTSNPVAWMDSTGNVVSGANPFVTSTLSATTTYWVYDSLIATSYNAGASDNSFATGGYLNYAHNLIFNVQKAGSRTFQMTNSDGGVMATATVALANGGNTVNLNFDLPVGGPYYLGPTGTTINLYRNSAGAQYPYSDADGIVSITGNDAGDAADYYYFCYNWVVKEHDCLSLPVAVTAAITGITTVSPTVTAVACNGGNTGSVSLAVQGGTPSYSYNWSNGQTSGTISNLTAGTYGVTIKDASGCSATASESVTQPQLPLTANPVSTNVSCNGGDNGSILVGASGGTGGYTFSWGSVGGSSRTGLVAGTYTVTVTDAHNCTATAQATITQPSAISVNLTSTNTACGSAATGSAVAGPTGGSGGFTYKWNTGATASSISNLAAATYNVTVTDAHGCTAAAGTTVTNAGSVSATTSAINVSCYGSSTGSASVAVTGAASPISYSWSNGATSSSINSVAAGTYQVTVTDSHGCSVIASDTIDQPNQLSISVTANNAGCNLSDGSVELSTTGGTGTYKYLWSNNSTAASLSNLASGNYGVTVTDANGCTSSTAASITNVSNLVATMNTGNVTCFNASTGSASVDVQSGSSPFTYLWSNGNTTASISNIAAGNYQVTITDALGCNAVDSFAITQPSQLTLSVNVNQPACPGINSGYASATANGGTPSYTILWSNNGAGENSSPLLAGNYAVTVHDLNGCSATSSFSVDTVQHIQANPSVTNASCYNEANGTVQLSPTGGTSPFRYTWTDGKTLNPMTGLSAGTYEVTITDSHNCIFSTQVSITQPEQIQFNTTSVPATSGENNGQASVVNITGGTAPYTNFNWSDGQSTQTATNLAAGVYSVTVTDNSKCSQTASVIVSSVTGINEIAPNISLKVYPNPAQTEAIVLLNNAEDGAVLVVRDVLGRMLISTPLTLLQTKVDVSNFANGVYTIQVIHGERQGVAQLIVTR